MNQNNGVSLRGMSSQRRRGKNHRAHKHGQGQTEGRIATQDNGHSSEERGLAQGSAVDSTISPAYSHLDSRDETPTTYDKNGKPLIPHGNETYGDIMLHPAKQYLLHKMRMEKYEHEKETWNEKVIDGKALAPAETG